MTQTSADIDIPGVFLETVRPYLPYADGAVLTADSDLAALGLDSMGVVQLLSDLEERFGLELPDELLTEETFETVGSLWLTVAGHFAHGPVTHD